jgi:hypothetical protein
MTDMNSPTTSESGLTVNAYLADGAVLLAFNLDQQLTNNLAGFAVKVIPPTGSPSYIFNRLNFSSNMTSQTTPEQREWTPSNLAPIQKFRWYEFPQDVTNGIYTFEVTAMYFDPAGGLKEGPTTSKSVNLLSFQAGNFEIGFTRGYLSSQGYASKFNNAPFCPSPRTIGFDTTPYQQQYKWLGYHAYQMVFGFIQECLDDPTITVDMFAYDLDEPDFVRNLVKLGSRLRAVLDDAPLHTKPGALEINAKALLVASAGEKNIVSGHFKRFSHCKVLIQKKNGVPVKVLTGSANFSVRGLYVQANNVLIFNDPTTAGLYEQAFNQAFTTMNKFDDSPIAKQWFDINNEGLPPFSVAFSPHETFNISLDRAIKVIQNAKSSIIFAVMELEGGGPLLQLLQNLGSNNNIFSYGITQSAGKLSLFKPGQTHAIVADFSYLTSKVPAPFRAEYSGGPGQVIHDKFVVVDFNDANPMVFTGSSNLSEGGEEANGDNLLAISDPVIVTAYAVEGIRLVDHYHFRMVMQAATQNSPLQLQGPATDIPWWHDYYDPNNAKYNDRMLFSRR